MRHKKNSFTKNSCNSCGSIDTRLISYGNHLEQVNLFFVKHWVFDKILKIDKLLPRLLDKHRYLGLFSPLHKIIRCNSCGYGRYTKKITEKQLSDYYEREYWGSTIAWGETVTEAEMIFPDSRALKQYAYVKQYLPKKPLNILDIGAGNASATRYIRKNHKSPTTISVIEPGSKWKSFYENEKIDKIADFFPAKLSKKFDYIHTSHWLEHVLDIDKVIVSMKKNLKKGGRVFVEVPNCDEDYFRLNSQDIPHIHFFTKESLIHVFENHGFKMMDAGVFGYSNRFRWSGVKVDYKKYEKILHPNPDGCQLRAVFEK